jgi:hypothetical protein
VVEVTAVQKARREGKMADIYEANKEASAQLTARNRARRKAEKAAAEAGAAVAAISWSSDTPGLTPTANGQRATVSVADHPEDPAGPS